MDIMVKQSILLKRYPPLLGMGGMGSSATLNLARNACKPKQLYTALAASTATDAAPEPFRNRNPNRSHSCFNDPN